MMKKTLYILRHAQPDHLQPGQTDFERSITKQGKSDAINLGEKLNRLNISLELFVSSSAKRAATTAKAIAESIDREKEILYLKELYLADIQQLANIVVSIDDSVDSALLVAHNPGLTDFVNYFTGKMHDNLSPCCLVTIEFPVTSWRDIKSGEITFTWSPDKLRQNSKCNSENNLNIWPKKEDISNNKKDHVTQWEGLNDCDRKETVFYLNPTPKDINDLKEAYPGDDKDMARGIVCLKEDRYFVWRVDVEHRTASLSKSLRDELNGFDYDKLGSMHKHATIIARNVNDILNVEMMDSGILKASNKLAVNIQQAKWLKEANNLRKHLLCFSKGLVKRCIAGYERLHYEEIRTSNVSQYKLNSSGNYVPQVLMDIFNSFEWNK